MCATVSCLMYGTIVTTIMFCSLLFSALTLCVISNTCSLDLYSGDLQTTTVFFTRYVSRHKTDRIFTTSCLLCLTFLHAHVHSLTNVHEVECFCFHSLYRDFNPVCVFCSHCLQLHSLTFSHTDVVGLLVTSSLYLFVYLLFIVLILNDSIAFPFSSQYVNWPSACSKYFVKYKLLYFSLSFVSLLHVQSLF